MLKVTGGGLRGRNLKTPPGLEARPTASKVRQALFNILGPGRLAGARLADLYAGPGTLGIEALSRGAAWCLFVEQRRETAAILTANLRALGLEDRARVLVADAGQAGGALGPLDLLLADPPYNQGQVARALAAGLALLGPGGLMVLEHSPRERPAPPPGLETTDHRVYGQTELSFLLRVPAPGLQGQPEAERRQA